MTHANTRRSANRQRYLIHVCAETQELDPQITLRYVSTFMSDGWSPLVHWDVRNSLLTFNKHFQLQRQFVTEPDGYKMKDVQAARCDWPGQTADSFSTLGKSEEEKNEQKTDTLT